MPAFMTSEQDSSDGTPLEGRIFHAWSAAVMVLDGDAADAPILHANPAFCTLTGYAADEAIGRPWDFLQNDDSAQPGVTLLRQALAQGQGARAVVRNYRKDGSLFWNDLTLSPVLGANGKASHFIVIAADVSPQAPGGDGAGAPLRSTARRTLLLVDDEPNIVASLKRLLRRDNYEILTANGGQEGLDQLAQHAVDVIVSDQRMPGMTGVEFLRKAKETYPDTVRIVLSGFTELQSVTDAVNEGAVYKFLTKPWDDTQLRGHVEEAFRRKELADENRRLNEEIKTANQQLASANRRLEDLLDVKKQQLLREHTSLEIVREALQHVPLAVLGVDDENMVVFANYAALQLFAGAALLGSELDEVLPGLDAGVQTCEVVLPDGSYQVVSNEMGRDSLSRGRLITLTACEGPQ